MLERYSFYGVTLELILVMGLFFAVFAVIMGGTYWYTVRKPDQGDET
ncbi:hypothetical protein [Paenibacillus silviterrae]|nr:hypothetical protein [Paenibacillus chinjuensis]